MPNNTLIFLGGRKRGSECLKLILDQNIEVAHVFCLKEDSHEVVYYEKIEDVAARAKIPFTIYQPSLSAFLVKKVSSVSPSALLAVGWRNMIKDEVLAKSTHGGYLIHDSLLPRYRGSAPSTWAVINGESRGGVSLFKMSSKVDAGPIVGQESFSIDKDDYIDQVFSKVDEACLTLIKKHLRKILNGTAKFKKQNDSKATYGCLRTPDDGEINWSWDTTRIYNWIRALSRPNPGAFSYFKGQRLLFWKAKPNLKPFKYEGRIPGCVVARDPQKGIEVLTGDGSIFISEVQFSGKEPQSAYEAIKPFNSRFTNR